MPETVRLLPIKNPAPQLGARILSRNDPETKAHTTTAGEREIATKALGSDAIPVGSKLYYYDYQPTPYTKKDGTTITLTHSFLKYGQARCKICAIAIDGSHCIFETDENNPVPAEEWAFAKDYLTNKAEKEVKLPAYTKIARTDYPELMHCFFKLCINGKIVIEPVDGIGFYAEGGMGRVKFGEHYAHKIQKKHRLKELRSLEVTSSIKDGLFIGVTRKKTGFFQPIFTMKRYNDDLYYFCKAFLRLQRNISERASFQLSLIDTLVQVTTQLITLHKKGLLHRDVKLENTLLLTPDAQDPWKVTEAILSDRGFIIRVTNGVCLGKNAIGTKSYSAPEILTPDSTENYRFSEASDAYALGVMLFRLKTFFLNDDESTLASLSCYLNKENPNDRPHLVYVQLILTLLLQKISKQHLETVLIKNQSPLKEKFTALLLNNFFMKALAQFPGLFSDLYWMDVLATLEKKMLCKDETDIFTNTAQELLETLDAMITGDISLADLDIFKSLYFIWENGPFFSITSADWLAQCTMDHDGDINYTKVNDLYWLYTSTQHALQLFENHIALPLETTLEDEHFWNQVHQYRTMFDSTKDDEKIGLQEGLMMLLAEKMNALDGAAAPAPTF